MQNQNSNLGPVVVATLVISLIVSGLVGLGLRAPDQSDAVKAVDTKVNQLDAGIRQLVQSGALSSPALGPWFSYGDIIHDGQSSDVTFAGTATSTACAILSPAATSTLSRASLRVATEPYANTWKIFRASTPTTQTTLLAQNLVGTTGSIIATTTTTTLTDGVVLPNSYINFVVATTTAVNNNFNAVVHCEATFIEL